MENRLEVARLGSVKGQTVLWFKGALIRDNDFVFLSAVRREDSFPILILDLSNVPYIDSSALGTLVSAYVSRRRMGRQVVLFGRKRPRFQNTQDHKSGSALSSV